VRLALPVALLLGCNPESPWSGGPGAGAGELPDGFHLGVNLPWRVYGRDVGSSAWGHDGISKNAGEVDAQLGQVAETGVVVVRWFVLTDGRSGVQFDSTGMPTGLDEESFDDFGTMVDLAEDHGLMLVPVILDYLWLAPAEEVDGATLGGHAAVIRTEGGRTALVDEVYRPLLQAYGERPGIVAWDLINEPEWGVEGVSGGWLEDGVGLSEMQAFVALGAEAVHEDTDHLATVGGASTVTAGRLWGDSGIDLVQLHAYEDDALTFDASTVAGELPAVVGELGTTTGHGDLPDNIDTIEDLGYLGAWPWSLNADDDASGLTVEDLAEL